MTDAFRGIPLGALLVEVIQRSGRVSRPTLEDAVTVAGTDQTWLLAELMSQLPFAVVSSSANSVSPWGAWPAEDDVFELRRVCGVLRRRHRAKQALVALGPETLPRARPLLLYIDHSLAELPMLGLARDLARQAPPLLRRVVSRPLLSVRGGCVGTDVDPDGPTIALDPVLHDEDLHRAWAHELGHALDRAYQRRAPDDREEFADALGDLLLRDQPDSLGAACSAIVEALDRVPAPPIDQDRSKDDLGPLIELVSARVNVPHVPLLVLAALRGSAQPTAGVGGGAQPTADAGVPVLTSGPARQQQHRGELIHAR